MAEYLRIDDRLKGVSVNSSYDFSAEEIAWFLSSTAEGIAIAIPEVNTENELVDFRFVFSTSITEKMFNINPIGGSLLDFSPGVQSEGRFEQYKRVIECGEPASIVFQFQRGKSSVWINMQAVRIRGALLLSCKDITNDMALAESEERYRFMLGSIPHLIWTADSSGTIDFQSKQWVDYTGQPGEQQSGWFGFIHPVDYDTTVLAWNAAIAGLEPFKVEHRILNSRGEYRWFKSNSRPMLDPHGNTMMWMGTSTDIHEEMIHLEELTRISRELEEKNDTLERINNDLDTFVYTASHDLTAPINNIEGLTNLIRYELNDCLDVRQREYLDLMTRSTNKLHANIKDLTEIISIKQDTGRVKEAVFFLDILKNIQDDLLPVISVLKAQIITDFRVKSMLFARKNLRTILFNLISNALKYRSEEKRTVIHISTSRTDSFITLKVTDNGTGIAKEQLPQMFGIYKRFHKDIQGHGVGLYMIKRIIENNGGHIEVTSDVNKGTTFLVHFHI